MKLSFNIESNCGCEIIITETTPLYGVDGYLQATTKDAFSTSQFRKQESKTLVRLKKIIPEEYEDFAGHIEYKVLEGNKVKFTNQEDGWYKLEAITLPTLSYIKKIKKPWNTIYYYVSDDNRIFHYDFKNAKSDDYIGVDVTNSLPVEQMFSYLERAREEFSNRFFAFGFITDYFSICNLLRCYINYINMIFKNMCGNICISKENFKSDIVYKRDLVKMALDIIKYLVMCGRYEEANRLLTQMYECNGLCNKRNNPTQSPRGCGCTPPTIYPQV